MSLYFYPSLFPMLNVSCSLVLNAYSDISDGVSAFMSQSCWNSHKLDGFNNGNLFQSQL